MTLLPVDLNKEEHRQQLIRLLNTYMQDEMGGGESMSETLAVKILDGLINYPGYLGFFVLVDEQFAALANCNRNFSTFKAKPLINIHDLIVHPDFRGKGAGTFLLNGIASYAEKTGCCRINLEVRNDNTKAQHLYKKCGFAECCPPMFFWEKNLD